MCDFLIFCFQERCINAGTLTVNYEKVDVDYRLKHNDLLANIVHRYLGSLGTLLDTMLKPRGWDAKKRIYVLIKENLF